MLLKMFDKKITEAHRKQIGENIRRARKSAGITQADLAKALGCRPSTITHYESGFRPVTCDIIRAIAEKIGIHPAWIVDPEGVEYPIGNAKPEFIELAKKAIQVLQSGTHYSESLILNIESFYAAVVSEKTFEARLAAIERKLQHEGRPPALGQQSGNAIQPKTLPVNPKPE